MQPPKSRARREGKRSSISSGRQAQQQKQQKQKQQLVSRSGSDGVSGVDVAPGTRTLLSGNLSRCSPLFGPSSETVFCACSSSVLGVSVETGEQLLRLEGHANDVTAMLMLPPGVYGPTSTGERRASASCRRLLTSSMDGTLRLWDVTPDLMSLEGEAERCLRVFEVGMPVYNLFLGRQDASGAALDVILVTKEGTSSLHGLDDTDGVGDDEQTSPLPGGLRGPSAMSTDEDKSEHESDEEDDDSSDSEGEDNDTHVVGDKGGAGVSSSSVGALAAGGDRLDRMETTRAHKKRLYDWQTVRYGLAKGKAETILQVSKQQRHWIGATAPRSPIRTSAGGYKRGETCPVLLSAVGRVVTAVDAGTGDEAVLMRATGVVCSVAVGDNGELLMTGHVDGSMSQWHALPERVGAAFGVAGFGGAVRESSTDMHWHAHPVNCMDIASDGVQVLSGGEEAVLVQWNLAKGTKAFLPRLGAPLQGLAVSPSQENAVVTSRDNAVTLVGLAGWDVMWQMRGLALSRARVDNSSLPGAGVRTRQALKLTMEPRRGLVACNGRAGHVQFYNVATDCLEASAEVVRFNRNSSAKLHKTQLAEAGTVASAGVGPVVEHVVFSADGKRMVAVVSRVRAAGSSASPSLSFWKHTRGSDPYGTNGYTGSYAGAKAARKGVGRDGGRGGTSGHWAADTSVDDPHGPRKAVSALEYHPSENVVVTAAEDGGFNLWGLRRSDAVVESIAAGGGNGARGGAAASSHWACSLSVRYKAGLSATGVSFCSDGSVLAVAYSPTSQHAEDSHATGPKTANHGNHGQGIITLWSLETVTLLSTLLPPRTRDVRSTSSPPLKSLGFLPGSGRIFASGKGYAAVWDMVSAEPTPLWEYRAHILAATTADAASVFRSGKAGISVEGRGFGDVALCVDAASLGEKAGDGTGSGRGSVVLLLNSGDPVPLHTWRLPNDTPTCLQLLLDTTNSGGRDGVLCLTRKGELVLLSVASREGDGKVLAPRPQVNGGLGVVRVKHGASAPALHLSTAAKRQLLEVDLAGSDPALMVGGKRARGDDGNLSEEEQEGDGHVGGREAMLRSGRRASDILDPSSIHLAPVPDLYEAFMATLLKPAPQSQRKVGADRALAGSGVQASAARGSGAADRGAGRGKGKGKRGGAKIVAAAVDEGLLSVLAEQLKAGVSA